MSMLVVLNNFIRKRTITKSTYERSDFSNGQASKLYRRTGIHFTVLCILLVHVILQGFTVLEYKFKNMDDINISSFKFTFWRHHELVADRVGPIFYLRSAGRVGLQRMNPWTYLIIL